MRNTKRRDTKPELALRSALHGMGLRFSVDRPVHGTRRRSDVVFPTERVAVYVDGCFWHGCPKHGTVPKQNRQWWMDKLAANRQRDADTDARSAQTAGRSSASGSTTTRCRSAKVRDVLVGIRNGCVEWPGAGRDDPPPCHTRRQVCGVNSLGVGSALHRWRDAP